MVHLLVYPSRNFSAHKLCVSFLSPQMIRYSFLPLSPFHLAIYLEYFSVSGCIILPKYFKQLVFHLTSLLLVDILQCCLNLRVYISLRILCFHYYVLNSVKNLWKFVFLLLYKKLWNIIYFASWLANIKYLLSGCS